MNFCVLSERKKNDSFASITKKGGRLGGTCVNVGCVPKKVTIYL
jgi:pyruvate/2-oxoglutarate dehydrogenase complex dihydrolipoamide dehydrogenase (E3) component